ncbi:MAG: D-alanine--D-alanine ligase [Verrucomicrobiota bacterium]|nr:D-alanine--D-alanine ligase [Verrucomicrobiota bacterium]
MRKTLQIVVMLGGPSAEREISLRSGRAVAAALRSLGHSVTELDPAGGGWTLPESTDVVFLALHGSYGEDGTIQHELDLLNIPYTGCDAESSRVAFDKALTKERCIQNGIPTATYKIITRHDLKWPENFRLPAVLKPVRQGSSVGLHFINQPSEFPQAVSEALKYDEELLLEERIIGRETTVGILDGTPLPIVEVRPKNGTYDFSSKYNPGMTEYLCPAPFDPATTKKIQNAALEAFGVIGGRDYGRVDVMVTNDGAPVVLEVNTLPGMTETSLLPKAAAAIGLSYPKLCQRMIELALLRGAPSHV